MKMTEEMNTGALSLLLVSVTHSVNHIYQLAPSIVLPKLGIEYGLSKFEVGLILLAFNLPYALLQAPFGSLARRLGRRRLMVLGLLVSGLAFTGAGLARGPLFLGVMLFVAGVGCSTYHALGIPLISDLFPARRGEALGYHQTGGSIGSFIAPLVIGLIMEASSWRMASLSISLFGVVLVPILWYGLRDTPVFKVETVRPRLEEMRGPLVLVLSAAIYVLAFRGLQLFGIYYFDEGKGLGNEAYLLMSVSNIGGVFSGPVFGRLSDTADRKRIILALVLVEGLSAFGVVFLEGVPLYFMVVIFGFAFYGLLATMDAFIADVTKPQHLGTVIGINMTASFVTSSILSPVLGGSIGAIGYDSSFIMLAALTFLSIPLITQVRHYKEKQYWPRPSS